MYKADRLPSFKGHLCDHSSPQLGFLWSTQGFFAFFFLFFPLSHRLPNKSVVQNIVYIGTIINWKVMKFFKYISPAIVDSLTTNEVLAKSSY